MIRLYNSTEDEIPNTAISCGIYFHGNIRNLITDLAKIEVSILAKNDKITKIEIPSLKQDGVYEASTLINCTQYLINLYYWKIKTKNNVILHRGLAVLKDDKDGNISAKRKLKFKYPNL